MFYRFNNGQYLKDRENLAYGLYLKAVHTMTNQVKQLNDQVI